MVRVHNHFLPDEPQPLFTFTHPNRGIIPRFLVGFYFFCKFLTSFRKIVQRSLQRINVRCVGMLRRLRISRIFQSYFIRRFWNMWVVFIENLVFLPLRKSFGFVFFVAILPKKHTTGMFSWFPIFFPFKVCLQHKFYGFKKKFLKVKCFRKRFMWKKVRKLLWLFGDVPIIVRYGTNGVCRNQSKRRLWIPKGVRALFEKFNLKKFNGEILIWHFLFVFFHCLFLCSVNCGV